MCGLKQDIVEEAQEQHFITNPKRLTLVSHDTRLEMCKNVERSAKA